MTLRVGRLLLALTLGLTAGCGSSMKVATDFDRAADFTALGTYTLIRPEPGVRRAVRPASERQIIAAVTRELETKGYRAVSSDPDFRVGFNVVVADEVDEQTLYTDQKLGYVSSATEVRIHQRGTLVLFITERGGWPSHLAGDSQRDVQRPQPRDHRQADRRGRRQNARGLPAPEVVRYSAGVRSKAVIWEMSS